MREPPKPAGHFDLLDGQLPSPLVYPLGDNQRLIELIAKAAGKPRDWVRRTLYEEEKNLGTYQREDLRRWEIQPHVWSGKLVQFYKKTCMGVIGNPLWNRRRAKLRLRQWIGEHLARGDSRPLDILMIGDGAGFDSLYMALCGHRVVYSEEQDNCIALARHIFQESGVDVCIATDLEAISDASFDVVMCLDVLEHVPSPPETVARITRYLRPGGRLIVHAPFFFVTHHNPTHLALNRRYSGDLARLYKANGLTLVDGRPFWDPLVLKKAGCDAPAYPQQRWWPLVLRFSGLLLMVARWWSWPHNQIAIRAMQAHEPRWLEGLEPQ